MMGIQVRDPLLQPNAEDVNNSELYERLRFAAEDIAHASLPRMAPLFSPFSPPLLSNIMISDLLQP